MAIKKSDAVKFVYVNGNSLPSKVDDATIYIIGGTQELYVGNLKIAASIDVDSALSAISTNPVENQAITKELNKKATIESPTFTGIPNASTAAAGTSTTQIATTAFVQNAVTAATIVVDDALNATSTNPVQNKVIKAALDAKAALASPTFTGTPKAPTAAAGTNTTQIATTAFVKTAVDNAAVTVDSSLSDSSTNPVQNKIIKSALDGKANIGDIPTATTTIPIMDGTASVGSETAFAKGDHIHPKDTTKANLASPTFTGTPKAPTAATGTNTTQIATTAFVNTAVGDAIAASDAMIFKGTLGTGGTITSLPTTYSVGWTYRVITAGTYAGNTCEVGDLIIALTNRSGSGNVNADWTVAQTNINGAITSITGTSPIVSSGSGSSRTLSHADSGVTAASKGDTTNQTPTFGDTFKVPSATVDAKGHLTALDEHTVKIPNATATTSSNGLMSSSDKTKLDGIASGASVTGVKGSAENSYRSGDVNLTATNVGALPITGGTVTGATTVQGTITAYREGDTASDLPAEIRFSVKDIDTGKTYPNAKISAYQDHSSGTSYGTNMVIFSGGAMFLGSGEASENHYSAWKSSQEPPYLSETMYLTSDSVINIQANANTIEDRKGVRVTTTGSLIPIIADEPADNVQSIGNINYKWNAVYATTFYGDLSGSAATLGTARTIDGVDFDGSADIVHYGTCSTAAGTAAKVVSCTSYKLVVGSTIRVKFTVTNTAASPTLNVNGTGAKNIFYKGVAITAGYLIKDHVYEFVYDGTQYCLVGEIYSATTTNIGSATAGTAIAADDITAWDAGTLPTLGTAIPADDITAWSAGTLPTLGTAIPADDITSWNAGTAASASVSGGVLTITNGTAPSLAYTAKSIPNVTAVGTLPSLSYTAKSIPNVTAVGTLPSLTYTARSIPNISVESKSVVTGI